MKKPRETAGFTPAELRKLRSLKDPYGIQRFIDDMPYHLADTAWSPRRVLHEKVSTPKKPELIPTFCFFSTSQ